MRFALQARFLLFREASVIILVCGFKGIMYKMKFAKLQFTTLLSALAIASALLGLGGCGGGGGAPEQATTTTTLPPSTIIPVSGANSPLIGVTMTVTCANGRTGSGSVGTPSNPGEGSITVNGSCTAPILISATGSGKMRPIGAKDDGSEDVPYDPAINLPVGNVVAAFPNTAVPVNPVTALVAGQVSPATLANETASSLASKKASVASALGLPAASLDKDYRDAALAKAATLIVEVAALAVTNAATTGALPNAVTGGGTTLGAYVLEKIASQAASAGSGTLSNAATLAAALKQADPKLDATKSVAELGKIDLDAGRVNNLIATYAAGATSAADALSKIAVAAISASDANSPTPAQKALVADVTARIQEAAKEQVRNSVSKMVMNVAVAANSTTSNSVAVAQAAANNLLDAQFTAMAQAGARPADLAAKAMAVADSVTEALKTDLSAATKIFDTPPLVGNANAAAALVGQAMVAAADVTAASSPPSAANTAVAATNALRVATAIKDIVPPKPAASSISQAAYQAAFQAAVEAVANAANVATLNVADSATKANLSATLGALQVALATVINSARSSGGDTSMVELARQLARTALGASPVNFSSSVTLASVPATLPATTTTSSTSSTTLANASSTAATTTTSTASTTAAATTTTIGTTTTTTALMGGYFGIAGDSISFNGSSCGLAAFSNGGCLASSTTTGTESISFNLNPVGSLGDPGTTSFGLEVSGLAADLRLLRVGISAISLIYSNRTVWLTVPSTAEMYVYGRDGLGQLEANITFTSNIGQYVQISNNVFTFSYGALLNTLKGLGGSLFGDLDIRTGTFNIKTVLSSNFVITKAGGVSLSIGTVSIPNTSFTVTGPTIEGEVTLQ